MPTKKPDLYFDLSTLRQNRASSLQANGVTRTVWEVGIRLYHGETNTCFICQDARLDTYVTVDAQQLFSAPQFDAAQLPDLLGKPIKHKNSAKYKGRAAKRMFHRLRTWLRSLTRPSNPSNKASALGGPIEALDVPFLNLGNLQEFWQLANYLQTRAPYAPYFGMIHDISPLRLNDPEKDHGAKQWQQQLRETLQFRPHVIANSEYTRTDLLNYAAQHSWPTPQSTHVVHLAHEFQEEEATLPLKHPSDNGYFLLLGDIRYRKNAKLVFEAYLELQVNDPDLALPQLVCAGLIPNGAFAELNREQKFTPIGHLITIVQSPTQGELTALYKNAKALIYPSLFEGYGLPVGEALWMGTPVLASNATSIPEVGGEYCRYFDPTNAEELAQVIEALLTSSDQQDLKAPHRDKLRKWETVKADLLEIIHSAKTKVPCEKAEYTTPEDA